MTTKAKLPAKMQIIGKANKINIEDAKLVQLSYAFE